MAETLGLIAIDFRLRQPQHVKILERAGSPSRESAGSLFGSGRGSGGTLARPTAEFDDADDNDRHHDHDGQLFPTDPRHIFASRPIQKYFSSWHTIQTTLLLDGKFGSEGLLASISGYTGIAVLLSGALTTNENGRLC